jgi:hypothetical protein
MVCLDPYQLRSRGDLAVDVLGELGMVAISVEALIPSDVEEKGSVVSAAAWAGRASARGRVQRGILAVKRSLVEREIDVVRDPR